jgi:hypothetical protein
LNRQAAAMIMIQVMKVLKRILWTKREDKTSVKMKKDSCSWEEISDALPSCTPRAIQVRYFTKLGGGTKLRKHRQPQEFFEGKGCMYPAK